jgi:hypothetical protein
VAGRVEEDLENLDRAEARLSERAAVRSVARETRERRRALRRRLLGTPVQVLGLALGGTVVLSVALARPTGDLSSWSGAAALAFVAAVFLVPAALAGWLSRGRGGAYATAVGLATLGLQLALTFGIAFLLLGLGPAE